MHDPSSIMLQSRHLQSSCKVGTSINNKLQSQQTNAAKSARA